MFARATTLSSSSATSRSLRRAKRGPSVSCDTLVLAYWDDRNNVLGDGIATTDVWLRHSHNGGATWEPEQHLYGPFDHYTAPMSFFAPGVPRGLFLGDYMGLETISGNDVINFFTSTVSDGADVHAIRANHP
jgi:hypothetical protein